MTEYSKSELTRFERVVFHIIQETFKNFVQVQDLFLKIKIGQEMTTNTSDSHFWTSSPSTHL